MRGIYLNTDLAKIASVFDVVKQYSNIEKIETPYHSLIVVYDPCEWKELPVIQINEQIWACYGWFVYKENKNDFKKLIDDYNQLGKNCLKEVSAGVFLIVKVEKDDVVLINDPLGLSTHYIDFKQSEVTVSPSLEVFNNKVIDPIFEDALKNHGSLFGNYTQYKYIERIEPGSIYHDGKIEVYYQPVFSSDLALEDVPSRITKLCEHWPIKEKTIAISGGLDSRLILASSDFSFGYTYGPEYTGDRPIARKFKNDFAEYAEFSYLKPDKLVNEEQMCKAMFFGASTWVYRLFSAYAYAKKMSGHAHVFFDGYLGDVLQRGAYLKFPGIKGEFFRLFPWLNSTGIMSAENILTARYQSLSEVQMTLLLQDYRDRTNGLATDNEFAKLTYYEFVYGRGGRYVINGGNITCGQVFTVVPVFTELSVFHAFLSQSFTKAAEYKLISKIWKRIPRKYTEVFTETGFKPFWPAAIIPYVHFYNRLKLHFLPGGNYGKEITVAKEKGI